MNKTIKDDIIIRPLLYGDAKSLALNANNEKIAENQRESFPHPYTIEYAREWINFIKQHYGDTRFAIANKHEAIGEIGFITQTDVHRFSGEVAYWIAEKYWGQGIITKALEYIIAFAFEEKGIKRLYADVMDYNQASQRVLQKCGFKLDGVMRNHIFKYEQFHHQLVFSRLADDDPASIIQ